MTAVSWETLALLAALGCGSTLFGPHAAVRAQERANRNVSVADGVFTAAQVERGKAAYRQHCASCHKADLTGSDNAPTLAGPDYIRSWHGRSVYDVFTLISSSMPLANPGSLKKTEYLDITTYVLHMNLYPSGTQDLSAEEAALKKVLIVPRVD